MRLAFFEDAAFRPEITQDHARGALKRINGASPPNGPKNQQAKDSLLWEACIELSEKHHVSLITRDTAFFLDRDPKKGLARNLASEPAVELGQLTVFPSVESFLKSVLPDRSTQDAYDIERLIEELSRQYYGEKRRHRHAKLMPGKVRFRGFPNSDHTVLTIAFTALFPAQYDWQAALGYVVFEGECSFNKDSNSIGNFQIHQYTESYDDDVDYDEEESLRDDLSEAQKWLVRKRRQIS
jgi:hypothetical protein